MVDNDQVAEPAQPVRKRDTSMGNRPDMAPVGRLDEDALPAQIG